MTSSPHGSPPLPRPKSPPELYGKRREFAKVVMLEREIGFLQEELKSIETLQPASCCIKEVAEYVVANPEPLITTCKKTRKSCGFWKWLCGNSCFNMSWVCCCCNCCGPIKPPKCCSCSCSLPDCCSCSLPSCSCSFRPSCPKCLKACFGCPKCSCPKCPTCPDCPDCSCCCKCPSCSSCCCCPTKCSCFKLPKCNCFSLNCCYSCCRCC